MAEGYCTIEAPAQDEFIERKSRFIGHIAPVRTEEEAVEFLNAVRARHREATHNVYAYILRHNQLSRFSDDGEPQGTAGRPVLEVVQREGLVDVAVVVTRYFGGILLGAGGLTRAYSRSAKDALDASGISVVRPWTQVETDCPYGLFERLKLELLPLQGVEGDHDFGAQITFRALLPQGREEEFAQRLREISAGAMEPRVTGTQWKAVPLVREG